MLPKHWFTLRMIWFLVLEISMSTGVYIYIGLSPLPVTVTTRNITFLVGDPYKPSFATVTGRGDNPIYIYIMFAFLETVIFIKSIWVSLKMKLDLR